MKRILEGLEPVSVFQYFEDLTRIPHGSYNVKEISDYCVTFAKELGLEVYQDEMLNVVIIKEATKDYGSIESVIIQGHLDMVCEKNLATEHDFLKDPLKLGIDGDWLYADGTTLGGDDGIAVAYALALLASKDIPHPRLEVVFTTEEEVGMEGAAALDTSILKGKYLINIDSEEEGYILTSCAGGMKSVAHLPIILEEKKGLACRLTVDGLKGGHSGVEIDKGRGNANILLGRTLHGLSSLNVGIINMFGGLKDNAIPRESYAELIISEQDIDRARELIEQIQKEISSELRATDNNVAVSLNVGEAITGNVLNKESAKKAVYFLYQSMNGIQTMSFDIKGLVETSLNLGVLETKEGEIVYNYAVRSSKATLKTLLSEKLKDAIEFIDGSYEVYGNYPEWEFKVESTMRELLSDKFFELYGRKPEIAALHAGVECGLFAAKLSDREMDMVSIGPDMKDVHTPQERLCISSTARTWEYLLAILKDFGKYCK